MTFIKQIAFNIFYYGGTAVFCFAFLPLLILPRKTFVKALEFYFNYVYVIEKYILGLDYSVEGQEHIPKEPSYIIGAKHYSAYETMKLYRLQKDPAIILKKELMRIPLWGWLAQKAGHIAIDRSDRERAVNSIKEGAQRVKNEGRPIFIFPQGTRVSVDHTVKDKPYKWGIARMAKAAKIDIVPLAMNSGLFWPRNAFFKKPGHVTFRYLPAISHELPEKEIVKRLEEALETHSNALVHNYRKRLGHAS